MKRIAAFMLLVVLSVAGTMPAYAQRTSVQENSRQSQKAAKKAAKQQRKAMKKYTKGHRKAVKKANHRRAQ